MSLASLISLTVTVNPVTTHSLQSLNGGGGNWSNYITRKKWPLGGVLQYYTTLLYTLPEFSLSILHSKTPFHHTSHIRHSVARRYSTTNYVNTHPIRHFHSSPSPASPASPASPPPPSLSSILYYSSIRLDSLFPLFLPASPHSHTLPDLVCSCRKYKTTVLYCTVLYCYCTF